MDNVQIFPSRKRIEVNDKLTEKLFSMSANTYEKILTDGNTFYLIEVKNHKKFGDILSPLCIKLINGYLNKTPMDQFDRFVLAACISEWAANNRYTTPSIIYRHLTGKIGSDAEPKPELRAAILKSIDKMMCTQIKVDMSDTCQKLGYNDGKPFKITSTILPCAYAEGIIINGHPTTVIYLDRESPILTIAIMKKQVLKYEELLLNVAKQHNSIEVVAIKNYVLQRVEEIKLHKLTAVITFDDVLEKCRLTDIDRKKKSRIRQMILELMEHLKTVGEISDYSIEKHHNQFYSIQFTY